MPALRVASCDFTVKLLCRQSGKTFKYPNPPHPTSKPTTPHPLIHHREEQRGAACHASCRGQQQQRIRPETHSVSFCSVPLCTEAGARRGERGKALRGQASWPKSSRVWGRRRVAQSVCKTFAICLREINATQIICAKVLLVAVFVSVFDSVFVSCFFFGFAFLLPHFLQLNSKCSAPIPFPLGLLFYRISL